jgi:predicted DNA-binding transcriptional regulator AlpA
MKADAHTFPAVEAVQAMTDAELHALLVRLAALQSAIAARLAVQVGSDGATRTTPRGDDLLDASETARRIGMSVGWLYKHASRLPFTRRVGPRSVRFSAEGIHRYLARRG